MRQLTILIGAKMFKKRKFLKGKKPIRCKYWYKHYETDFDVERDVNIIILELQEHGYEIIDVVINYVKFNIEEFKYTFTVTILYK